MTYFILKISLIFLTAGLSNCDENRCPAPADIAPCTCSSGGELIVICDGDKNVITIENLQNALNSLSLMHVRTINYLSLSLFNMTLAPSNLFSLFELEGLGFQRMSIGEMPVLEDSGDTLQEIEVDECVFERSMESFFSKLNDLNRLKSFIFKNNNLHCKDGQCTKISFGNDWFKNCPLTLQKVDLSYNGADSFGDHLFSELLYLEEIDLHGNKIKEVHRSMFPDPANRLLKLELWNNPIRSLPDDIFSNMPALQDVTIDFKSVIVLDEHTWRPVWEQLLSLMIGTNGQKILICDSTIDWTFNITRPKDLTAVCDDDLSEPAYRARSLAEIIDNKGLSANTN